jgi:hypothetical protein
VPRVYLYFSFPGIGYRLNPPRKRRGKFVSNPGMSL